MIVPPNPQSPPIFHPSDRPIDSFVGRWWVAQTKSRFEKAFVRDLIARDISYFLPLIPRTHLRGGAKRKFLVPLFPSYVFFCGDHGQRADALATGRLQQAIHVHDQDALIEELSRLQTALKSATNLERCVMPRGQLCRVISGPMLGCRGVVLENHRGIRLVVQISILGQAFSLEIDGDLLEPFEPDLPRRPVRIAG
jgi:hypothetical protein